MANTDLKFSIILTGFISSIKAQTGICCLSTRILESDGCKTYLHHKITVNVVAIYSDKS